MSGQQAHVLDPCALILVANIDKGRRDQKEQTFYCHFACFRKLVNDDDVLCIMEPDYNTNGDIEEEQAKEADDKEKTEYD